MSIRMKVDCPRCGATRTCYQGESETQCNCNEYCREGSKPQDCTLINHRSSTADPWHGQYNYPQGMHLGRPEEDDNTQERVTYCTTHGNYVNKVPFLIKCNWQSFLRGRARGRHRFHKGIV